MLRKGNGSVEVKMYQRILLAYDGTREGRLALREGARLAQICGARVTLMAVVEPELSMGLAMDPVGVYAPSDQTESNQKILDEGVERLKLMGLPHDARLVRGSAAERIAAVAREISADLVVVGHHRQGVMLRWLIGSVTSALTDTLECSLLVAKLEISDDVLFSRVQKVSV